MEKSHWYKNNRIEIPFSKLKSLLIPTGAMLLVSLILIVKEVPFEVAKYILLAFLIIFIFLIFRSLQDSLGLIIDENGISGEILGINGLIEWRDIKGVEIIEVKGIKNIILKTDVSEKYIGFAKNGLHKKVMQLNYKLNGSPLVFGSSPLKIKFKDLENIIKSRLER